MTKFSPLVTSRKFNEPYLQILSSEMFKEKQKAWYILRIQGLGRGGGNHNTGKIKSGRKRIVNIFSGKNYKF